MKIRNRLLVLAVCALALGCGKKNKDSPFNGDFSTPLLDPNLRHVSGPEGDLLKTDYCYPDPDGRYGDGVKYTDKVAIAKGHDDAGKFDFGFGGACVNRPIREVWAVLSNQPVMVWSGVTTSSFVVLDPPGGSASLYEVNYHVENGFPLPSVDWKMRWVHSVTVGGAKEPRRIVIRYKKTSGTKFINYWEGSVVLDFITPTITAIAGRDQIDAQRTGPDDAAGSVGDIVNKARESAPDWNAIGGH